MFHLSLHRLHNKHKRSLEHFCETFSLPQEERGFVKQQLIECYKNRSALYTVSDVNSMSIGFFCITLDKDNGRPVFFLDYITLAPLYRGLSPDNSDDRYSHYLIANIFEKLLKPINEIIPIETVVIKLAHENLRQFYEGLGFIKLTHRKESDWFGLAVKNIF